MTMEKHAQDITPAQARILTNSLTGGNTAQRVYRNRFISGPGCDHFPDVEKLVADGLMVQIWMRANEKTAVYQVTEAGASAVGLKLPEDD